MSSFSLDAHWKSDVKLLPTNCTKKTVYVQSCGSVDAVGTRKVSLCTFRRLLTFIVTMRSATNLCWCCQKGVTKFARSANLPDAEKCAAVRQHEDHLRRATMERSCYKQVCKLRRMTCPRCHTRATCCVQFYWQGALQLRFRPASPLPVGPTAAWTDLLQVSPKVWYVRCCM